MSLIGIIRCFFRSSMAFYRKNLDSPVTNSTKDPQNQALSNLNMHLGDLEMTGYVRGGRNG
jgi:hypothetical protein